MRVLYFFCWSRNSPHFMELEGTLMFLEYTRTGHYLEPFECSPWPETLLFFNPV